MVEVLTRRATLSDAPSLASLSGVLGYPVAADVFAQRLGRLLARPEHVVLVAELATAQVVAWLHAAEQERAAARLAQAQAAGAVRIKQRE